VDVVRGPTANIYGSGAIGGVASFRTRDIQDVLRPGERWGVDMSGSYGSNNNRGLGSVFGGVRVDPTVDVFGGVVYRTQGNYKDGSGTEIGNTGNDIASGLMKLTVRPADGHEIKFGGIFQDDQYSIDCEELYGHRDLEILQTGRHAVRLECHAVWQSHRQ
jgi:hemoglobin/transferrin/lactoferrin receptor protein